MEIQLAETEVELTVVTRDEEHCAQLCGALEAHGYRVERLADLSYPAERPAAAAERDDLAVEVRDAALDDRRARRSPCSAAATRRSRRAGPPRRS